MNKKTLEFAKTCVALAKKGGASQAEAYCSWDREFSVSARKGEVENLKQATSAGVGLRLIRDGRLGFGYTSDLRKDTASAFVDTVLALAKETAKDENNGFPEGEILKPRNGQPMIFDPAVEELSADWKIKAAIEMEKVAMAYDPRIKTVSQVGVGDYLSETGIVTSGGLIDSYRSTYVWAYCVPFAQDDSGGQTDYWQDVKNYFADLQSPNTIAETAARRAVGNLGAGKIESGAMPVVFDPMMAKDFVGGLAGAINGDMIYKKSSFLLDKLNQQVASDLVTVIDDGTMDKGIGTSPFDGEGVPTARHKVLDKGVLKLYLYDSYTAAKAGTKSTGNALRGYSSLPSIGPMNFYMAAGISDPKKIVGEIDRGLYVTKMMGRGVNTVNGDYSRGAQGLLIEKGELTRPVQEITVGGNMLDMLKRIDAVGADLEFRGSGAAPTIRFSELTVSGK